MLACRSAVGAATILDTFIARKYTIYNLCTLASFGESAPREHVGISNRQYRVNCRCIECVRVACACAFQTQLECAFECVIRFGIDPLKHKPLQQS